MTIEEMKNLTLKGENKYLSFILDSIKNRAENGYSNFTHTELFPERVKNTLTDLGYTVTQHLGDINRVSWKF